MLEFIKILIELKEVLWTLVALVGIGFVSFSLIKAHLNPTYSKFSLLDAFAVNGVFSGSRARLNLAFIISSWVLVLVGMRLQTLTNDFVLLFGAYISAWVADRMHARSSINNHLTNPGGESKVESSNKDN
jgi:hypothetical protein